MTKNIDKRIIDEGFHTGHEVEYVAIQKSDYEYLKEQAERVQELEERDNEITKIYGNQIAQMSKLENENINLQEQNKRYREAIEDIKNAWKVTDTHQEYMDTVHDIIKDLEGEE